MASRTESVQLVESCVKLFQALSTDSSFGQFQTLVLENEQLRNKATDVKTAYDVNLQTLTGLQSEVAVERGRTAAKASQLEAANNTVAELKKKIELTETALKEKETQLKADAEGISKLQGELKKREAKTTQLENALKATNSAVAEAKKCEQKVQGELKTLKAELDERDARLSKLDRFVVKLEPALSDATRGQLGAIFKDSFSLMRKYMGIDLAEEVLSNPTRWNEMRKHLATRGIYSPLTNSSVAKKMRVAASLAILATELREHVFQPTYLLGDDELAGLLNGLGLTTSELEKGAHLRSVLLNLCPPQHEQHASERAKKASNNVVKCVGPLLLHESKQNEFASALHKICQDASRCWESVQRLANRVDPVSDLETDLDTDPWKLMEFPGMDGQSPKAQGSPSPGGKKNGARPKPEASGPSLGAVENIDAFVWPTFVLFKENNDQETLHEGLVLSRAQVDEARAEASRRTARQNSRRQSTHNGVDATAKKAFLSAGAGGPSGSN
ncbi:hypothetical protein CGRA01v4_14857 [Colletotrichum graminicola]|uniref:MEI5 protein n=1 Tax=Colletotrichum graminicola (strain M1.001 / M2 / FGSC 10212) TaxID=645133 RepID=E3QFE1_COLGM|nr:uncharacterized protein GLRG_04723 [Colletotrichum graminicola M1.001]EFQ29579.1 hypothetical protein GLRG_04723 [Colletotrichum graminicola M1.001]WDK23565.1 hypothetical protein CGRA01v4_14857 [Colletotrichum graminicola]